MEYGQKWWNHFQICPPTPAEWSRVCILSQNAGWCQLPGPGDGTQVWKSPCQLCPRWLCEPRSDSSVSHCVPCPPPLVLPRSLCKKNSTTLYFVKPLRNCSMLVMTESISWTHTQGISSLSWAAGHYFHLGLTPPWGEVRRPLIGLSCSFLFKLAEACE